MPLILTKVNVLTSATVDFNVAVAWPLASVGVVKADKVLPVPPAVTLMLVPVIPGIGLLCWSRAVTVMVVVKVGVVDKRDIDKVKNTVKERVEDNVKKVGAVDKRDIDKVKKIVKERVEDEVKKVGE